MMWPSTSFAFNLATVRHCSSTAALNIHMQL